MEAWYEWRDAPPADFAVIGDPVGHSLSPRMHSAAYRELGIDHSYVAVRVSKLEFAEALTHLKRLGYTGLNVTVPLKYEAYMWASSVPDSIHGVEAINTLRLSDGSGINTDGIAMKDLLDEQGGAGTTLVLGAGGTARAVMSCLSHSGYKVRAWNRSVERLEGWLDRFALRIEAQAELDPSGCQYLINATSASMDGESVPVDWSRADSGAIAIDLYYTDGKTKFQQDAESHGLRAMDGRKLLAYQGARSFEWWLGIDAPRKAMLDAVYED